MILIVLSNGEVDCVETDGVNDNRLLVVKNDPPIFDDIECLESWEPGVMNFKRKAFYQRLWAKNFSRIIRAEKEKSHPGTGREFDVEIEVSGGVAYLAKKRQGISVQIRDYDITDSNARDKFKEATYNEEEDLNDKR